MVIYSVFNVLAVIAVVVTTAMPQESRMASNVTFESIRNSTDTNTNVNVTNTATATATATPTSTTTPTPITTIVAIITTASSSYLSCFRSCLTTMQYNPVCGTDGIDYHNAGRLECARRCGKDVSIRKLGRCTSNRI